MILQESMRVNDKDALDPHVNVDTTVQEQNITYPTDAKLHHKIIQKCKAIARREGIERRRSYSRTLKKLGQGRRFRHHPKNKAKALKAERKVKTIAGRFVQELERKLSAESKYQRDLVLFYQVCIQKRDSKKRLYSLHEPAVVCISKGKEHKKYEFGNKVSICRNKESPPTGVPSPPCGAPECQKPAAAAPRKPRRRRRTLARSRCTTGRGAARNCPPARPF